MKRGRGARPILESEIRDVMKISTSARDAANKLGVNYLTFRQYATLYGLFDQIKNKEGRGIRKLYKNGQTNKYPTEKIFNNELEFVPYRTFKNRLIANNFIQYCCAKCGMDERRLTDKNAPLVIDFIDGNYNNKKLENLRFLCFNCYYLLVGGSYEPTYPRFESNPNKKTKQNE